MSRTASVLICVVLFLAIAASAPRRSDAGSLAPGTVNVQGSLITGQQGKIVLAFATPEGGGAQVARVCWTISDNASGAAYTVMSEVPTGSPCGPQTADVIFPGGVYDIDVGVYQGGQQAPEKHLVLKVQVDGNTFVTFNGIALSQEPVGDGNCDQIVDDQDVIASLESFAGIATDAACLDSANVICTDVLTPLDSLAILSNSAGIPPILPGSCPPLVGAPRLVSPADGAEFDVTPRVTPFDWEAVPGAASYVVQTDEFDSCFPYGDWCSDLAGGSDTYSGVTETDLTFNAPARGSGRWRVAAVDAGGRAGPFSEWRTFEHRQ